MTMRDKVRKYFPWPDVNVVKNIDNSDNSTDLCRTNFSDKNRLSTATEIEECTAEADRESYMNSKKRSIEIKR